MGTNSAQSAFLSDQDAQRDTYGIKGSSGLAPCLYCRNVLKKDSDLRVPGTVRIYEWDETKFLRSSDAEFWQLADSLRDMLGSQRDLEIRAKASGLNVLQGGLLQDVAARQRLPPSKACVDTLHMYFSNGVASWECGLLVSYMAKHGVSRQSLQDAAEAASWQRPDGSHAARGNTYIRQLLHEKHFDPGLFKGDGGLTLSLVFLLCYYVSVLLGQDTAQKRAVAKSFQFLRLCCGELTALGASWVRLRPAVTVRLRELQKDHMEAFFTAWGVEECKPKHHHRMHLPQACAELGWLPNCAVHEKKASGAQGTRPCRQTETKHQRYCQNTKSIAASHAGNHR